MELHKSLLPLVGDIIFVTSTGLKSKANRFWQKKWSRTDIELNEIPSHVAVCKGNTSILHATTTKGSSISSVTDFFNAENYKDNIKVFRSKELENKITNGSLTEDFLIKEIEKHWSEPYNYGVFLKRKTKDKKFCSEVVAIFLQQIDLLDSIQKPSSIFPIDLYSIYQDSSKWTDVTHTYRMLLDASYYKQQMKNLTGNDEDQSTNELRKNNLALIEYLKKHGEITAEVDENTKQMEKIVKRQ